jgi:hypothetical protein
MLARLDPDGDEAAGAGFAIGGESAGGEGSAKQAGLDEDIRNAAGAVVSVVFDAGVAAAADVGLVLEGVGSVNRCWSWAGAEAPTEAKRPSKRIWEELPTAGAAARGAERAAACWAW